MKTVSRYGPVAYHPWHFGSLALLFLTACATTPVTEEARPSDDDTVDIGYGTIDKDHVTGSVATVRGEDVQQVGFATLTDMLLRVPGVQVINRAGGTISVRIRGANTSFLGGQEPLFVVDGMVMQAFAGLNGINSNTIESITVLKDAGATAVYGTRGANGVILIKTRRGAG